MKNLAGAAILAIILLIMSINMWESTLSNSRLPACDSSQGIFHAQQVLNQKIAEEILQRSYVADIILGGMLGANTAMTPPIVLEINQPTEEISSVNEIRLCSGIGVLNNGESGHILYSFKPLGERHFLTSVRIPSSQSKETIPGELSSEDSIPSLDEDSDGVSMDADSFLRHQNELSSTQNESLNTAKKLCMTRNNEPYPCQLEAIIDSSDWPDVRSALAFASSANDIENVRWKNNTNGHEGMIIKLQKSESNCRQYQVKSFMGDKEDNATVSVCNVENKITIE